MVNKKLCFIFIFFMPTLCAVQYTTFLKERPISIKEQYFTHSNKYNENYYTWFSIGTVIEQSVGKNISPYFSINGTNRIELDTCGAGDINPLWLQLSDANFQYQSLLDWNMSSQKVGALFLSKINFEKFFIECNTAFVHVKNKMLLHETTDSVGIIRTVLSNVLIANAYDAFAHYDWEFGKLYGTSTTHGLDNIQIKFGPLYQVNKESFNALVTPYVSMVFPTSSTSIPEYIFQAQAGTNTFSLGTGVNCNVQAHSGLHFIIEAVYRYEFPTLQKRSFDLTINGNWSRYLMIASGNPLYVNLESQGINFFTQNAMVTGGHQASANFHVERNWNQFDFIAHYNIFARAKETITWVDKIQNNFSILDINRADASATSESKANISQSTLYLDGGIAPVITYGCHVNQLPQPDAQFTPLTNSDLNWESACSPTMLTSIFAIGGNYHIDPLSIQIYVAYELPHLGSIQKIDAWLTFQWDF